jgi:hypothetical protein
MRTPTTSSYSYDPHRLSPRAAPAGVGRAVMAYVLGRDRRHPVGWTLALALVAGLVWLAFAWLPFTLAGPGRSRGEGQSAPPRHSAGARLLSSRRGPATIPAIAPAPRMTSGA